jgi:hypothetical protein
MISRGANAASGRAPPRSSRGVDGRICGGDLVLGRSAHLQPDLIRTKHLLAGKAYEAGTDVDLPDFGLRPIHPMPARADDALEPPVAVLEATLELEDRDGAEGLRYRRPLKPDRQGIEPVIRTGGTDSRNQLGDSRPAAGPSPGRMLIKGHSPRSRTGLWTDRSETRRTGAGVPPPFSQPLFNRYAANRS